MLEPEPPATPEAERAGPPKEEGEDSGPKEKIQYVWISRKDWPAPIVPARECPPNLLPRNAAAALKAALANGWDARARFAMGWVSNRRSGLPEKIVASVVVQATKDGVAAEGCWEGEPGETLGFRSAWRRPGLHGVPDQLSAAEFSKLLKEN